VLEVGQQHHETERNTTEIVDHLGEPAARDDVVDHRTEAVGEERACEQARVPEPEAQLPFGFRSDAVGVGKDGTRHDELLQPVGFHVRRARQPLREEPGGRALPRAGQARHDQDARLDRHVGPPR
jgi:hypothetical protein